MGLSHLLTSMNGDNEMSKLFDDRKEFVRTYSKDNVLIGEELVDFTRDATGRLYPKTQRFGLDMRTGIRMIGIGIVGCLSEDTKLFNGRQLSEFKHNEVIDTKSLDFEKNEIVDSKSIVINSGVKEVFRIELENGEFIDASADHTFFVLVNRRQIVEKKLSELKPTDELISIKNRVDVKYKKCVWCNKEIIYLDNAHGRSMKCCSFKCSCQYASSSEKLKKHYETKRGKTFKEYFGDEKAKIIKQKLSDNSIMKKLYKEGKSDNISRHGIERAKNISEKLRTLNIGKQAGEKNPAFGKIYYPKARFIPELNHFVRSDWEYKFAKMLKDNNITYYYEYKTFQLDGTTYTPDFYIPIIDEYVEIKGPLFNNQILKMKATIEKYNINFSIFSNLRNKKYLDKHNFYPKFHIFDKREEWLKSNLLHQ